MAIKKLSSQRATEAFVEKIITSAKATLVNNLVWLGEKCITEARLHGNYQDQTGNLRSSIGFIVLDNGQQVYGSGFLQVKKGAEGVKEGEAFLQELISQNQKGIVLIVSTGMDYAAYVESLDYNVLTSSELLAEKEVPRMLKELGFRLK